MTRVGLEPTTSSLDWYSCVLIHCTAGTRETQAITLTHIAQPLTECRNESIQGLLHYNYTGPAKGRQRLSYTRRDFL